MSTATFRNVWCDVSTSLPTAEALESGIDDGRLYQVPADGTPPRFMASGIRFANGLAFDERETHIYVCQSSAMNVLRFPLRGDGTLGAGQPYGPVLGEKRPPGNPFQLAPEVRARVGITDGCGFDTEGNLWVTLVVANKVVAITPGGEVLTIIDDPTGELMRTPTNVAWGRFGHARPVHRVIAQ